MAHVTSQTPRTVPGFGLGTIFQSIGNTLVMIAQANSRVRRVETLNAMSDAELAKQGLKREDIVRHVFGDMYYL
ncbi:DUF1127 domain-containing protein [Aestuariivita sp.]|uniref:DUF1127 domain-containing protein n=1 Tax=Aestuariivita sp. TaxID=1872407 RepID=UPI00217046E4|nr:DUF1127 domain-containing protein [Aestuariivita sp.]MCE8009224.1 DUF1127 domain-containing protein [Aestuariivita sp.]